ncbi:MAG: hypothetical protein KKA07_14880 [Bacteroidetes bacterium]|nr:hypothetical protein [Bacteroidota bacterium]MBU1720345.1 hypothetical protein [Bacteroidota bacterium]
MVASGASVLAYKGKANVNQPKSLTDFDGITDPLDLFASPRMYPVMVLYIANRLKWDL